MINYSRTLGTCYTGNGFDSVIDHIKAQVKCFFFLELDHDKKLMRR